MHDEAYIDGQCYEEQGAECFGALLGKHHGDQEEHADGRVFHDAAHNFVHCFSRGIDQLEERFCPFGDRCILGIFDVGNG